MIRSSAKNRKIADVIMESDGMELKNIVEYLPENQSFTKYQFANLVREENIHYADSSVSWLLSQLKKDNKIINVGKGRYIRTDGQKKRREYCYSHQDEYLAVEAHIQKEFPLIEFQMWELYQMNEFVNHLFGKNIIFVEVENMCEDVVFDYLLSVYSDVLLQPNKEMYHKMRRGDSTIVVQRLISESPKPREGHSAPLEKIIVDLFSKKLVGGLISKSEYPQIFEEVFGQYEIDEKKMFRYARRRHLEEEMKRFIREKTTIRLRCD